ncbi:hypothetical protein [Williamsia muralis]|uniref:hypothetical protein n=1 Tax=Williamsia marianensis TaxID=85044 RepID=UPI003817B15E
MTDDEDRWITTFYEDGSVETVERPGYAESLRRKEWDAWGGGPPIPEVTSYNAGHELTKHARDVVVGILAADDTTARQVAAWCARSACEHAGLAQRPWVAAELDNLAEGWPPADPFRDPIDAFNRLQIELDLQHVVDHGPQLSVGSAYTAIPAVLGARHPNSRRAAMEALSHAHFTYGPRHTSELYDRLRVAFPTLPRRDSFDDPQ